MLKKRDAVNTAYHNTVDEPKKEINDLAAITPGVKEQLNSVRKQIESEQAELCENKAELAKLGKKLNELKME